MLFSISAAACRTESKDGHGETHQSPSPAPSQTPPQQTGQKNDEIIFNLPFFSLLAGTGYVTEKKNLLALLCWLLLLHRPKWKCLCSVSSSDYERKTQGGEQVCACASAALPPFRVAVSFSQCKRSPKTKSIPTLPPARPTPLLPLRRVGRAIKTKTTGGPSPFPPSH